jgi:hypothetical protein
MTANGEFFSTSFVSNDECVFQAKIDKPDNYFICLEPVNDMRKIMTTLKLCCPSLNIRMIFKLFHTDKEFDGMFIRSISHNKETEDEEESYSVNIYRVQKIDTKTQAYGKFDVFIDNTTNWKTFKQHVKSIIDECPICCEVGKSQLQCPICAKFICSSCVLNNLLKTGNQRCPYCACNMDTQYDDDDDEIVRGGLKFVMKTDIITDEVRMKIAIGLCEKTFKRKIDFKTS